VAAQLLQAFKGTDGEGVMDQCHPFACGKLLETKATQNYCSKGHVDIIGISSPSAMTIHTEFLPNYFPLIHCGISGVRIPNLPVVPCSLGLVPCFESLVAGLSPYNLDNRGVSIPYSSMPWE
jgi:hypothetical protein